MSQKALRGKNEVYGNRDGFVELSFQLGLKDWGRLQKEQDGAACCGQTTLKLSLLRTEKSSCCRHMLKAPE